MASTGINVLRWTALGFGVVYGAWHQSSLSAQAKHNHIQREYLQHQTSLVEKAKEEYKRRLRPQLGTAQRSGVITDPDDSRFDLEAYLKLKAGE